MSAPLASEQVGQFFFDSDRIEYSEFGSGDRWVVLIHGQLMPRTMHGPLARVLAADGFHVVTVDLLGHGRSDRPEDPKEYSMTAFGDQVVALLDHLGAERAIVGGTSLGANVGLEVASIAPDRVQGLLLEMPVLDNGLEAGIIAFGPLLFIARFFPAGIRVVARASRLVPRRGMPLLGQVILDTLDQRPGPMAAMVHGIFFGRVAPSSRIRKTIEAPAIVIGHPHDPIHLSVDAEMVAEEMPNARYVRASSILEWRIKPERLNRKALEFVTDAWNRPAPEARHA